MKNKEAMSFGIIGEPDENTPQFLEEHIGEPVKMGKKRNKTIFIIGRGLFRKAVSHYIVDKHEKIIQTSYLLV